MSPEARWRAGALLLGIALLGLLVLALAPDPTPEPSDEVAPGPSAPLSGAASRAPVRLDPSAPAPALLDPAAPPPDLAGALAQPAPPRPSPSAAGASTLRPVRGRVIDAATRQPIAGAWVAWRLPPPELVEQLLPRAEAGDPGISDAEGRFALERLPDDLALHSSVHAVAPGYAYLVHPAPLAAELELALTPAATLELVLDPPPAPGAEAPPVRVRLEPLASPTPLPLLRRLTRALPPWGEQPERYWLRHLPAGRYRLHVDPQVAGERVHELSLTAGQVSRVRIQRAPRVEARGVLSGPEGPLADAELLLIDLETATSYPLRTGPAGTFARELPLARYRVRLLDGRSERALPGEHTPGPGLQLELPERGDDHSLRLTRGGEPLRSDQLGLVRLDLALGDLIDLPPGAEPGSYLTRAPAGRYALFEGACYLAELELPRLPGAAALDLPLGALEVALRLPTELRPDEAIRGTLALLPSLVHGARPDLAERFLEAAALPLRLTRSERSLRVPLAAAGSYRLLGQSDLGPLRATHELEPGGRIELEWP